MEKVLDTDSETITAGEVATRLGLSRWRVHQLRVELGGTRAPGRRWWRFDAHRVAEYAQQRERIQVETEGLRRMVRS